MMTGVWKVLSRWKALFTSPHVFCCPQMLVRNLLSWYKTPGDVASRFVEGVPNKHSQVGSKTARGTITCNTTVTPQTTSKKTQNASRFTVNFRPDNETAASFHFIISIQSVWISEHMKRRGQWFGTRISNWTSNSVPMEMCQRVRKTKTIRLGFSAVPDKMSY